MPVDHFLAFAAASALLILTPGPMVALIVSNSVTRGVRAGFITITGSVAAMSIHLVFVTAGLASLLAALGAAFFWLKWIGALYLFCLGLRALFAKTPNLDARARPQKSDRRTFAEAFAVAFSNPKVLIFYAAFFPLFIAPDRPALPQLFVMSATFLILPRALIHAGRSWRRARGPSFCAPTAGAIASRAAS